MTGLARGREQLDIRNGNNKRCFSVAGFGAGVGEREQALKARSLNMHCEETQDPRGFTQETGRERERRGVSRMYVYLFLFIRCIAVF